MHAAHLAQTATEANFLYAHALVEGQALRQLLEWTTFVEWGYEHTWPGLELWEADQTLLMDAAEGNMG